MKDPAGKPAPAGGFQNGGWYSGYQYWDGSFAPQAGMIHPKSNQSGAGQMVSAEVNRQTSVAAGLDPNANQNYVNAQNAKPAANPSAFSGGGNYTGAATVGSGSGMGYTAPEVLNLPKLYDTLYANSGIKDLETQYSDQEKAFIEAKGKINDNPFLSEATRVGRVAKLESLFNERTANIKNDIATKKADIETRLNLETKQFDINSQAAQQALSQFNTLLSMGALDNASGEDIANITRSTGLSSQAIQSAVDFNRRKNMQTQVITSTNDAGEVTAVVIDTNTGNIVNQTSLGKIGNAQGSGGGSQSATAATQQLKPLFAQALQARANSYGHIGPTDWVKAMNDWVSRGGDPTAFITSFSNFTDPYAKNFEASYGFSKKLRGISTEEEE